jgi:glycosyltransferase involved in cell wall biosynthesis
MRVAFYAPMKGPMHPTPSGDREMARLFMEALRRGGHEVFLASSFRSRDEGDPARQERLADIGLQLAHRFLRRGERPDLWFTYHLYEKAPDWIGPRVAEALEIPYVVAEASLAPSRAQGCWRLGHEGVVWALQRAASVIGLNSTDRDGVLTAVKDPARWVPLKPFIDASRFQAARGLGEPPRIVAVGMMRHGDKLASYRVLGAALAGLLDRAWRLDVVGDGPARSEVEAALSATAGRVTWHGLVAGERLPALLAEADLYAWPAVNEAFGMAFLEAQAAGLPIVGGRTRGVPEVVADGETGLLSPEGDAASFAADLAALLDDPDRRRRMGEAAARRIRAEHDLDSAARRLDALLRGITAGDRCGH